MPRTPTPRPNEHHLLNRALRAAKIAPLVTRPPHRRKPSQRGRDLGGTAATEIARMATLLKLEVNPRMLPRGSRRRTMTPSHARMDNVSADELHRSAESVVLPVRATTRTRRT